MSRVPLTSAVAASLTSPDRIGNSSPTGVSPNCGLVSSSARERAWWVPEMASKKRAETGNMTHPVLGRIAS